MTTHPTTQELLQAVIDWLDTEAKSAAAARGGYMAKVARNALAIVQRDFMHGPGADAEAQARLRDMLNMDAGLATLEAELSTRIRNGAIAPDDPAVMHHLRLQVRARLAIDQPKYKSSQ